MKSKPEKSVDELLNSFFGTEIPGWIKRNKAVDQAKAELLQLLLSALPEKKTSTADSVAEAKAHHYMNQGYNQGVDQSVSAIKELFGGKE